MMGSGNADEPDGRQPASCTDEPTSSERRAKIHRFYSEEGGPTPTSEAWSERAFLHSDTTVNEIAEVPSRDLRLNQF